MKFDDRLATVLSTIPNDAHDRAVRWRQLVDLVSRGGADAAGSLIESALMVIRAGREDVPDEVRAATARSIAGRDLPLALVAAFAEDRVVVAAPLLSDAATAAAVRGTASDEVGQFIDALHPPATPMRVSEDKPEPATTPPPLAPFDGNVPTIDEVVARIEQLRASREHGADIPDAPVIEQAQMADAPTTVGRTKSQDRTPDVSNLTEKYDNSPALFRWECGPGGDIGWVEGAPRGAIIGRSIARGDGAEGVDHDVERAFARRSPFRDAILALPEAGVVEGRWLISGVPAFALGDGRFIGYRGIARRGDALNSATIAQSSATLDPTALRELVHEIKTPLNAIVGFAEIIDGQYLGPAQTAYRARAADIVVQAQVLLRAIDDLDFAARLQGDQLVAGATSEFTSLVSSLIEQVKELAANKGASLAIDEPGDVGRSSVDDQIAGRLIVRFAEAVLTDAAAGETLRLAVRGEEAFVAVRLSRPRAIEELPAETLFSAQFNGSSLRLLAGLARIVGARVDAEAADLVLRLPQAVVGPEGFEPPT